VILFQKNFTLNVQTIIVKIYQIKNSGLFHLSAGELAKASHNSIQTDEASKLKTLLDLAIDDIIFRLNL